MEPRGFRPSIQRHPERLPLQSDRFEEDLSMKSDDDVGGDYEDGTGRPIFDISKINEPKPPVDKDESDIEDDDGDEDDDSEPDYNTDIKPYHKVPVQRDGHVEPPTTVEDIPYDPEQDAEWHRKRQNPDDPDSVPRGVWKMDGDK